MPVLRAEWVLPKKNNNEGRPEIALLSPRKIFYRNQLSPICRGNFTSLSIDGFKNSMN